MKYGDVKAAVQDLKHRTLAGLAGDVAQLVYLASTRDYNTGNYYHEGLALQFGEETTSRTLTAWHQEIFCRVALSSLEDLVKQLDSYIASTGGRHSDVLETWKKLEPYRVTIPLDCDPLSVALFLSNVRIALAVLEAG